MRSFRPPSVFRRPAGTEASGRRSTRGVPAGRLAEPRHPPVREQCEGTAPRCPCSGPWVTPFPTTVPADSAASGVTRSAPHSRRSEGGGTRSHGRPPRSLAAVLRADHGGSAEAGGWGQVAFAEGLDGRVGVAKVLTSGGGHLFSGKQQEGALEWKVSVGVCEMLTGHPSAIGHRRGEKAGAGRRERGVRASRSHTSEGGRGRPVLLTCRAGRA